MRENADQNNSKFGHFSRNAHPEDFPSDSMDYVNIRSWYENA